MYSIDLARTEGVVVNFRNGFAMPEAPPVSPPDVHTVTGQPQPQTPGTSIETVVREDGSVVREEVPIPGWQPGDPWGHMPYVPPPTAETPPASTLTDLGNGLSEEVRGDLLINYRNGLIVQIRRIDRDDAGRAIGETTVFNLEELNRSTGDPGETLVGLTGEDQLGGGLLNAMRNSGATIDLVDYDITQGVVTGIYMTDATVVDGHATNWAMGNTGMAEWFGDVVGVAYDSDSSYAYTMLSDGAPFEAIPEPTAIVITFAGFAMLVRRRRT